MTIDWSRTASSRAAHGFLSRTLADLAGDGWDVEIAEPPRGPRTGFALVARANAGGSDRAVVIHAHCDHGEVRVSDVWAAVARLNDVQGDFAVICLGPGARLTPLAETTAARVGVRVRRLD